MTDLATVFTDQAVQLCSTHQKVSDDIPTVLDRLTGSHLFQPKLDGMRCLAIVNGAKVRLQSRTGTDLTGVYPEVVTALAALDRQLVLDGELVHYGPDGLPAFTAMSWRNSQRNTTLIERSSRSVPVSFVVFDLLWLGDHDLRRRPLHERLLALESLQLAGTVQLCPSTNDGHALWASVQRLNLEGVVAKLASSRYAGQRSSAWVKIKEIFTASVIVGNVLASERRTVGKVEVHALADGGLVSLGEVGTGWTDRELADLARRVRCYSQDPAGLDPVVIDVAFTGRYPDGKLKFASFKGLRQDVDWTTCTIEQEGL